MNFISESEFEVRDKDLSFVSESVFVLKLLLRDVECVLVDPTFLLISLLTNYCNSLKIQLNPYGVGKESCVYFLLRYFLLSIEIVTTNYAEKLRKMLFMFSRKTWKISLHNFEIQIPTA